MSVTQTEPVPDAFPVLRLLPAPPADPPYDDDPADDPAGDPAGDPAAGPAVDQPGVPTTRRLRLVPPPAPSRPRRLRAPLPDDVPVRDRTGDLPAPGPTARALVQRLVEVRAGTRPLPQLQRETTPGLYAELERHLRRRPAAASSGRSQVLSVHVQGRPDGVAEVCATVRCGDRVRALALRLEALRGRWTCTVLVGL